MGVRDQEGDQIADVGLADARGELVLGGALADPVDGAVLVFKGESPAAAKAFAAADPYVRHGLVTRWRVRAWSTVAGDDPSTPIHQGDTWVVFSTGNGISTRYSRDLNTWTEGGPVRLPDLELLAFEHG